MTEIGSESHPRARGRDGQLMQPVTFWRRRKGPCCHWAFRPYLVLFPVGRRACSCLFGWVFDYVPGEHTALPSAAFIYIYRAPVSFIGLGRVVGTWPAGAPRPD